MYKEHLPVSQVAVGDTNRPGSEAKMTVGPLRCQGDSKSYIARTIYLMLQPVYNKQTRFSEYQFRLWHLSQEHSEQESVCHSAVLKANADITYTNHNTEHWIVDPEVDLV